MFNSIWRITELKAQPCGDSDDGHLQFYNLCVSGLLSYLKTLVIYASFEGHNANMEKEDISDLLCGIVNFHQLISFTLFIHTRRIPTMTCDELLSPFLTLRNIRKATIWLSGVTCSLEGPEIQ